MKVTKAQIKPVLLASFPEYKGQTFKVEFTDKVTFTHTNWDGGTKNTYKFVNMANGSSKAISVPAPWVDPYEGLTIGLPDDVVVAVHSIVYGRDCGITFYAHPSRQRMLVG